jgi:beta-mannanase
MLARNSSARFLRAFAVAVRDFDCPLMLSFGHEMNRPWFSWGARSQPAAAFVAAWRHIHDIFAAAGANGASARASETELGRLK